MKFNVDPGASGGYLPVTAEHMRSSATALTGVADAISSAAPASVGARPLYVRLAHMDHGAFLSPLLFGFSVLPAMEQRSKPMEVPLVGTRPPAHLFRAPNEVTEEAPFTYAVVANHSVATQIQHVLSTLSRLVARQELVGKGLDAAQLSDLDQAGAATDESADHLVSELLRSGGWRAAARAVGARSSAIGQPLVVKFSSTLMSPDELARRAPSLRHVYNNWPVVRETVDAVATLMSQGLSVGGGANGPGQAFARDLLDLSQIRTYLAHLSRDAFVCGNGYLSFGSTPDEDLRLLRPETVRLEDPKTAIETIDGKETRHTQILHVPGARQGAGLYGMSSIEPLLQQEINRELWLHQLEIADAWTEEAAPKSFWEHAQMMLPLSQRSLAAGEELAKATLSTVRSMEVQVPRELYFPGAERMAPAAERLSMHHEDDDADA